MSKYPQDNDDHRTEPELGPLATPAEEKRLILKIDAVILTAICIAQFVTYLDRNTLVTSSVWGVIEEFHLEGRGFTTLLTMHETGQLIGQIPAIYMMSRMPLVRCVGISIILWGIMSIAFVGPKALGGLMGVRLVSGIFAAPVFPGLISIAGIWYTKKQHASRLGLWSAMISVVHIMTNLFMYGVAKTIHTKLAPWRMLFLIEGLATIVTGIVFCIVMPSTPKKAWFLTPREKSLLLAMLERDREGGDHTRFSKRQFMEAVRDIRAWWAALFMVALVLPTMVNGFTALLIRSLHYDSYQTLLLNSPAGLVQLLHVFAGIYGCRIFPNNRCAVMMALLVLPLLGNVLIWSLPLSRTWGLIVGSWMAGSTQSIFGILTSLNASNVKGNTKRAVVNVCFNTGQLVSIIAFAQLWEPSDAPRYRKGISSNICALCVMYLLVVGYWYLCWSENKRRDTEDAGSSSTVYSAGEDITDIQDRMFRYSH